MEKNSVYILDNNEEYREKIKNILKDNFDTCLRMPTNNKIRALNLSNTVAIMVFEALRQQNFNDLDLYDTFKGKDYITK